MTIFFYQLQDSAVYSKIDLNNAPATFMDLVNWVFRQYPDNFLIVFVDDILVYLKDNEEHKHHLSLALKTLQEHQLLAKFSKCGFRMRRVHFIGHVI